MNRTSFLICAAGALVALAVPHSGAAQAPLYSIINVNEVSQYVIPASINDNDQIAGIVPALQQGFIWMPGLPSTGFDSVTNYEGLGINNFGVIGGYFIGADTLAHASHWTPTSYLSATYTRTEDDTSQSALNAINDDGFASGYQVVGGVTGALLLNTASGSHTSVGANTRAAAVNNVYEDIAGSDGSAAFWADPLLAGPVLDLPGGLFGGVTFTGTGSATGISDADDVVGAAIVAGGTNEHGLTEAFAWNGYTQTAYGPLGFLHGTTFSKANAINSVTGEVVGQSGTHAFLWQGDITNPSTGTMTDMNALVERGSGWLLTSALAVNSGGDIVGTGYYQNKPAGWIGIPTVPTALALDSNSWSQSSSGSITGTVTFTHAAPFDLGCTVSLYNESTGTYSTGTGTRVLSGSTVATFRIPMPASPVVTIPEAYLVKLTFGGWRLYAPMVLTP
ncbi:MAG: hypothetical protein KGJ62_15310 [Armatimonadetes bacterium]|nr:hypothetical protein [Armatimonadota bacterium]MDE2207649.1 hypothetical protein [Armatimonadota bacterium]